MHVITKLEITVMYLSTSKKFRVSSRGLFVCGYVNPALVINQFLWVIVQSFICGPVVRPGARARFVTGNSPASYLSTVIGILSIICMYDMYACMYEYVSCACKSMHCVLKVQSLGMLLASEMSLLLYVFAFVSSCGLYVVMLICCFNQLIPLTLVIFLILSHSSNIAT